jgi:hypothetical protein
MEETLLLEKIHDMAARMRLTRRLRAAAGWFLGGVLTACVLVLALRALGYQGPDLVPALAPLLLFPLGGLVGQLFHPGSLEAAALEADLRLGTRERLVTAVEWILSKKPRTVMAQALVRDAAAVARQIDPRQAFPIRRPANLKLSFLLLPLLAALMLAPPWLFPGSQAAAAEMKARVQQAERLEELARRLRQGGLTSPARKEIVRQLEELARDLRNPQVSRRELLSRAAGLAEEARRAARQARQEGPGQGRHRPGSPLQAGGPPAPPAEQARRLRELARGLQGSPPDPQAVQAVREGASQGGQGAGQEALRRAARALEKGDPEEAARALTEGAGQLEAAGDPEVFEEVSQALEEEGEVASPRAGRPGAQASPGGQGPVSNPGAQNPRGESPGQADFGVGTTSQEQRPQGPPPENLVERQAAGKTSDWSEAYQKLYAPRREHRQTADARVQGQMGPGTSPLLPSTGEVRGAPAAGGLPLEAEGETYITYRQQAEKAVVRENVPPGRRDLVRQYFEGIDPR